MKFEKILPLLCFLLDPFTNRHCRTWSSMINLWRDSRTCQKWRILLSARSKFNYNYLELSKENVLRNMMLSHWLCFTWKFFMIWFQKILKFLKQPLCPRNECLEHWRKLPNLTAFLQIKEQFFLDFWVVQSKFEWSCQFWNEKSVLQILHYSSLSWHITPL